ncbi:hypothetical protein ACFX1Z_037824 [Malus domestica]
MGSFHAKYSSASVLLCFCISSIIPVVVICGHHFYSPVIISDSKQDRYSRAWILVVQLRSKLKGTYHRLTISDDPSSTIQ